MMKRIPPLAFLTAAILPLIGCKSEITVTEVLITDNPLMVLEKQFSVTLSEEASLAIRCERSDEPE